MSDFGSMVHRILEEAEYETGTSGTIHERKVKRFIIDAIKEYRWHRFWFTEKTFNLALVADQDEYNTSRGFPDDIERLMFVSVEVTAGQDEPEVEIIDYFSLEKKRREYPTSSDYPDYCAMFKETLYVYPDPEQAYDINGLYVQDIGTPSYQYSGGSWSFTDEDGAALLDTYSNRWFTDGEELIRAAAHRRFAKALKSPEDEAAWRDLEQGAMRALSSKKMSQSYTRGTVPYI